MQPDTFDVVIVGSGASGGTLAAHLARRGVRVALVEGGPRVNTRTDFNTHALPFDFPNRQIPTMRPGKAGFDSERSRGVGGKTMLWNAVALRLSQRDFKGRTYDGAGEDWPIDYKDIAPYYDAIEREVGVCGNRDGLEDLPDGVFLPPVPLKCSDEILQRAPRSRSADTLIHVRKATLTVATKTRLACHFCGNCMAGCDVVAKYNSADVHIEPAEESRTGHRLPRLHRPRSARCRTRIARRASATCIASTSRKARSAGRTVVVACACVQSVALLLMSTSRALSDRAGELERSARAAISSRTSRAGSSACSRGCAARRRPTTKGFSITPICRRSCTTRQEARLRPQLRRAAELPEPAVRRLGEECRRLRASVTRRRSRPATRRTSSSRRTARCCRTRSRYVDLDVERKDKFGLPQPRRHVRWGANEEALFNDMVRWSLSMLQKAGAEILTRARRPGDRTTSSAAAAWDAIRGRRWSTPIAGRTTSPNLYVVDGSVFPSASEKNPTHTIMALAARAAEHIADRMRKGDL